MCITNVHDETFDLLYASLAVMYRYFHKKKSGIYTTSTDFPLSDIPPPYPVSSDGTEEKKGNEIKTVQMYSGSEDSALYVRDTVQ